MPSVYENTVTKGHKCLAKQIGITAQSEIFCHILNSMEKGVSKMYNMSESYYMYFENSRGGGNFPPSQPF